MHKDDDHDERKTHFRSSYYCNEWNARMLTGYTINGAIQLGIEDKKGSIAVGKDADFLVFDNDLLTAEHEGFSYNMPRDVFFCGKKVN